MRVVVRERTMPVFEQALVVCPYWLAQLTLFLLLAIETKLYTSAFDLLPPEFACIIERIAQKTNRQNGAPHAMQLL